MPRSRIARRSVRAGLHFLASLALLAACTACHAHGASTAAALPDTQQQALAAALRAPDAEIFAIDVSFAALKDPAEREYLNLQPTSFVLTDDAVDRLRAAAGKIIADSPEFQRLLEDVGGKVVAASGGGSAPAQTGRMAPPP